MLPGSCYPILHFLSNLNEYQLRFMFILSTYSVSTFQNIRVLWEAAGKVADTCLLHHSWELMQRASPCSKSPLPWENLQAQGNYKSAALISHAARRNKLWTSLTCNLPSWLLSVHKLYAWETLIKARNQTFPVCAVTGLRQTFQVLIIALLIKVSWQEASRKQPDIPWGCLFFLCSENVSVAFNVSCRKKTAKVAHVIHWRTNRNSKLPQIIQSLHFALTSAPNVAIMNIMTDRDILLLLLRVEVDYGYISDDHLPVFYKSHF